MCWVGGPIKINSFFRSIELNEAIGGSSTSQHCEGRAMDIDDTYGCKTNSEMFNYIKDNLDFDQLIWEFGDDEEPNWIHVSWCLAIMEVGFNMQARIGRRRTWCIAGICKMASLHSAHFTELRKPIPRRGSREIVAC